jgi:hypothetical protein
VGQPKGLKETVMFYVLESREGLLKFLPKNAVGAEVGVAHGDFSEQILRAAEPQALHLIDPWSHLEEGSDLPNSAALLSRVSQWVVSGTSNIEPPPKNAAGDKIFEAVAARFASVSGIRLHRQYSYKAVHEFPDQYFDFVYVDGNHNYEFVLRDLHDFAGKLKRGGLLFGHDFFEDAFARENHYGVIDAVNSFLKRSDFHFFMLTWEPFSTFCLTNDFTGFAGQFLRNCLDSDVHVIELPESIVFHLRDKNYVRRSGVARRIPSFVR